MKLRFIPKKEREELKQQKQVTNNQQAQYSNGELNGNHGQSKKHYEGEMNQNNGGVIKNYDNMGAFGGDQPIENQQSDHQQNNNVRERSREKNQRPLYKQLKTQFDKSQKKQVENMKKKYMGLIKPEKSSRYNQNYKSKLIFQWDKSQDTTKGLVSETAIQSLKKLQNKNKNKDQEIMGKSWKEKRSGEMTDRDWRIFRQDNQIFIKGGRVASPFRQWDQNQSLHPELIKKLKKLRFDKPKPIQMQAIPIGIEQKDMVALAPTGQGKTLAFLIPMLTQIYHLERVTGQNANLGPYAIILVPSRQLAEQIEDQFQKIKYGNITAARMVGGLQLSLQVLQLQKGCDIVIGTPGRIKQLIQKHCLVLGRCFLTAIDQADKMISENLVEDLQFILDSMQIQEENHIKNGENKSRILSMFSATMLPQIQKLTKKYLLNPVSVTIGQPGAGKKDIEQYVQIVNDSQKNDSLGKILKGLLGPIIVFVNTRVKCSKIVSVIESRFKRSCSEYHGGKSQQTRQNIIQNFRQGKFQVLVATDLGGRGLDIKGISAAISYDAPKNISEFIHRAGRSGRAGVKGKAYTLLTNQDQQIYYDIRVFMQKHGFKIPQQLREHPAAQVRPGAINHVARRKQIVYTN